MGKYNSRINVMLESDIEPDCEDFYLAEIEEKAEKCDSLQQEKEQLIKYLEDKIKDCEEQVEYVKTRKVLNRTPNRYISEGVLIASKDILEKVRSGKYE